MFTLTRRIILYLAFFAWQTVEICIGSTDQVLYSRQDNKYLRNHVIRKLLVKGEIECGLHCAREQSCNSVNFQVMNDGPDTCELNDATEEELVGSDLLNKEGATFLRIVYRYGSQKNPGFSCANILENRCEKLDNGIYWLRLSAGTNGAEPFPVFCDMVAGGFTLVFKAIAGVPGVMSDSWKFPYEMYEHSMEALNKRGNFRHHYKNRIVRNWSAFKPNQVRVVLYNETKEEVVLRFNARHTSNLNWFSENNLLEAPWVDIKTKTKNFFSVDGYCRAGYCRAFYINHVFYVCTGDIGWMSLGNLIDCAWDKRMPRASFLYSKMDKAVKWNDYDQVGNAEVFAVYVH